METNLGFGFGAYLTNLAVGMLFFLLVVKLLDIAFSRKFSPGWRYGIAVAMAAFFLIPVRVFFPWSVIPVLTLNVPLYIKSPDPVLLDGISEVNHYSTGAEAQGDFLYEYFFYIWAAGAIITLLYQIIRLGTFYRSVSKKGIICENPEYKSTLAGICSEMKVKVPGLVIFPEIDTPFAMGIFSPKIILPPEILSENETEYIFRHEVCHIKRHDIPVKLFLIIFRCVNWFNPLAYILVKNAFSDMEIACDERACKEFSSEQREEYSKTLLKRASRVKCPAVTTYLSPGAKVVKRRIDAVLNVRRFGKAIPFTAAFAVIFMLSQTCYAMPDEKDYAWYIYIDPYPMEADPYITSPEWRTAEGADPKEAGEKIFRQYMEMYMGDYVPEYYRIEDYYLESVFYYDQSKYRAPYTFSPYIYEMNPIELSTKGIFTPHEYLIFHYSFIPANKCGNTVHNKNFGDDGHLNGVYNNCQMAFELEKNGSSYTAVNMGSILLLGSTDYHFSNKLERKVGIIDQAAAMAQAGLLDYSWNDRDNLPDPDDICEYSYVNGQLWNDIRSSEKSNAVTDEIYVINMSFGNSMDIDESYIAQADCIISNPDGPNYIDPEKVSPDKTKGFEYCGFETDLEECTAVIYGNVTGDDSHGVKLYLDIREGAKYREWCNRILRRAEPVEELFTPVEYHDSFDNIPLPEGMTSAEEILEYMKTPHDGCDFTVMDYNNLTEEADGTYANVCFKGRLDGLYSSDLKLVGDGYIKVKVI